MKALDKLTSGMEANNLSEANIMRDIGISKDRGTQMMAQKINRALKSKGFSDVIAVEPIEGHYNVGGNKFGATVTFIRVHDLDDGGFDDIYHTERGLPHPLKPAKSLAAKFVSVINSASDYHDVFSDIDKLSHQTEKKYKIKG